MINPTVSPAVSADTSASGASSLTDLLHQLHEQMAAIDRHVQALQFSLLQKAGELAEAHRRVCALEVGIKIEHQRRQDAEVELIRLRRSGCSSAGVAVDGSAGGEGRAAS
ncbi:MAG: hypothetical protein LBK99_10920 [Opitutaceae bacterium]|jgi:hypothetical protein|nr:hypothetical protein [Opitutaceae bacterium]